MPSFFKQKGKKPEVIEMEDLSRDKTSRDDSSAQVKQSINELKTKLSAKKVNITECLKNREEINELIDEFSDITSAEEFTNDIDGLLEKNVKKELKNLKRRLSARNVDLGELLKIKNAISEITSHSDDIPLLNNFAKDFKDIKDTLDTHLPEQLEKELHNLKEKLSAEEINITACIERKNKILACKQKHITFSTAQDEMLNDIDDLFADYLIEEIDDLNTNLFIIEKDITECFKKRKEISALTIFLDKIPNYEYGTFSGIKSESYRGILNAIDEGLGLSLKEKIKELKDKLSTEDIDILQCVQEISDLTSHLADLSHIKKYHANFEDYYDDLEEINALLGEHIEKIDFDMSAAKEEFDSADKKAQDLLIKMLVFTLIAVIIIMASFLSAGWVPAAMVAGYLTAMTVISTVATVIALTKIFWDNETCRNFILDIPNKLEDLFDKVTSINKNVLSNAVISAFFSIKATLHSLSDIAQLAIHSPEKLTKDLLSSSYESVKHIMKQIGLTMTETLNDLDNAYTGCRYHLLLDEPDEALVDKITVGTAVGFEIQADGTWILHTCNEDGEYYTREVTDEEQIDKLNHVKSGNDISQISHSIVIKDELHKADLKTITKDLGGKPLYSIREIAETTLSKKLDALNNVYTGCRFHFLLSKPDETFLNKITDGTDVGFQNLPDGRWVLHARDANNEYYMEEITDKKEINDLNTVHITHTIKTKSVVSSTTEIAFDSGIHQKHLKTIAENNGSNPLYSESGLHNVFKVLWNNVKEYLSISKKTLKLSRNSMKIAKYHVKDSTLKSTGRAFKDVSFGLGVVATSAAIYDVSTNDKMSTRDKVPLLSLLTFSLLADTARFIINKIMPYVNVATAVLRATMTYLGAIPLALWAAFTNIKLVKSLFGFNLFSLSVFKEVPETVSPQPLSNGDIVQLSEKDESLPFYVKYSVKLSKTIFGINLLSLRLFKESPETVSPQPPSDEDILQPSEKDKSQPSKDHKPLLKLFGYGLYHKPEKKSMKGALKKLEPLKKSQLTASALRKEISKHVPEKEVTGPPQGDKAAKTTLSTQPTTKIDDTTEANQEISTADPKPAFPKNRRSTHRFFDKDLASKKEAKQEADKTEDQQVAQTPKVR